MAGNSYSALGGLLDGMVETLAGSEALAGVAIFSGPVDDVSMGKEAIILGSDDIDVEFRHLTLPSAEVFEEMSIPAAIWVTEPGAGETAIAAARSRAIAIMAALQVVLLDALTTAEAVATYGVDDVRVVGYRLSQRIGDGYRDCRIAFRLAAKARFTPA